MKSVIFLIKVVVQCPSLDVLKSVTLLTRTNGAHMHGSYGIPVHSNLTEFYAAGRIEHVLLEYICGFCCDNVNLNAQVLSKQPRFLICCYAMNRLQ